MFIGQKSSISVLDSKWFVNYATKEQWVLNDCNFSTFGNDGSSWTVEILTNSFLLENYQEIHKLRFSWSRNWDCRSSTHFLPEIVLRSLMGVLSRERYFICLWCSTRRDYLRALDARKGLIVTFFACFCSQWTAKSRCVDLMIRRVLGNGLDRNWKRIISNNFCLSWNLKQLEKMTGNLLKILSEIPHVIESWNVLRMQKSWQLDKGEGEICVGIRAMCGVTCKLFIRALGSSKA